MRRTYIVPVLIALGACASANSGRDGDIVQSGDGRGAGRGRGTVALPVSAAAVALDHAAELSLAESQRSALEAIRRGVDSANAPLRVQLDSLRPTQRPVNPRDMGSEEREQMNARRAAIATVVGHMRDNVKATRERTYAILTPEQRTRMEALEADARQRAENDASAAGRSDDERQMRRRGRQPQED